jgi:hypothetical protein
LCGIFFCRLVLKNTKDLAFAVLLIQVLAWSI